MLVYKLQSSSYLSTFHAEYVALLQSTRHLIPMETLVSEVVKEAEQDTKRLDFSTHSTVSEDNYEVVKVIQNHKLPLMSPRYNHIAVKCHWFIEKIYGG